MYYRRSRTTGATWFFTVNLADRKQDLLVTHIDALRHAVREVKDRHSFEIVAMVVLLNHLHAIWSLPPGDSDYPMRWSLVKAAFSRALPKEEGIRESRLRKRERGIWQRRYWEHEIRDGIDLQRHIDYVHFNAVKHCYVSRAVDWSYSSIHRYMRNGTLSENWASDVPLLSAME